MEFSNCQSLKVAWKIKVIFDRLVTADDKARTMYDRE